MELLYANTKLVALGILVLQNCSLILLLRYSRIEGDISTRYTSSTAVLTSEFLKFLLSLIFVYYENFRRNISISQSNYDIFIASRIEILKISIPAGLYVVQNNLQYISASNLPASIFQVLSQLKIVTTAIFSVLMLSKKLSFQQWAAVVALTCGVALVQYSNTSDSSLDSASVTLGLLCITLSCVTSGFAGVYFEKVLKSGSTSLWLRNIHLSAVGMVLSVAVCALSDGEVISRRGFFAGYTVTTWSVIVLQAGGGLVVSVVVKYADNVLKGFATSFSVVVSCLVSAHTLEHAHLSGTFLLGASVVVGSALVYSLYPSDAVATSLSVCSVMIVPGKKHDEESGGQGGA